MENKYLNEAIIGNKKMLATFTQKGEMQRMYFPSKDNKQYINFFHTGVKVNESDLIYLHDDINNIYKQYYDTDTNILNTEITNTYFNLKILQTDYCLIKENVLAKKYIFINEGKIVLSKTRDELLEMYGIVKCSKSEFEKINKNDYVKFKVNRYEYDVLVEDKSKFKRKYDFKIIDKPTLDDIMLIYIKGEKSDENY